MSASNAPAIPGARVTIGVFVRPCGRTSGTLRFHADSGLLHPAAVGRDGMLDIAAPDRPALVRSADDGDPTTGVMPVHPIPDEGEEA